MYPEDVKLIIIDNNGIEHEAVPIKNASFSYQPLISIQSLHPRTCTYSSICNKPAISRTGPMRLGVGEMHTIALCVGHKEKYEEEHLMRGGIVPDTKSLIG